MRSRALMLAMVGLLTAAAAPAAWPPWISIESPVNPFGPTRGALFIIHAAMRDGIPSASDVSATAEGLVKGVRRTVPVRLEAAATPGAFIVRKQWPTEGTWLVRVMLHPRGDTTTALVMLNAEGQVASAQVPTYTQGGNQLPRAVPMREVDSALAAASRR